MQEWLYRTGVGAYHLGIGIAARLGNERARHWIEGRRLDHRPQIEGLRAAGRPILWLHAASLGEYEQGLPVLRQLRRERPDWAVVVTFFSPSGFERCRDSEFAEVVAYLPRDNPDEAAAWQELLRPKLAIFVKYEFWHHHLAALRNNGVPTFLVAGRFRPDHIFFRSYGGWWRGMLDCFTHFFVQTPEDADLLERHGYANVTATGDPRIDRTAELAAGPFTDDRIARFAAGHRLLIAGSVWPPDVRLIRAVWPEFSDQYRLILAPHQLKDSEIMEWGEAFGADRYTGEDAGSDVLILDTVGILSRIYRYGDLAYVGGAFGSGLHNTLEPLSYGLPVIFGPKHDRFPEAVAAVGRGGAFTVDQPDKLREVLAQLSEPESYGRAHRAQEEYLTENRGAAARTTQAILRMLMLLLLATPLGAQSWPQAEAVSAVLDATFTKCNLMVAVSGLEWRPGLCLSAGRVSHGGTLSVDVALEAGRKYVFIASADAGAADIDLYLRDGADGVIAMDKEQDKTPVVEAEVTENGTYTLQLHLLGGRDSTALVSLGMLQSPGGQLSVADYRQVSRQFVAAAGAVRAAGGAGRFGSGTDGWSVYGYLLDDEAGATLANVSLPAGRNFLAATGGEGVLNLDLFVADNDLNILRSDTDPDPYPMIEYDHTGTERVQVRVEVVRSRGESLVLLGLFTRD